LVVNDFTSINNGHVRSIYSADDIFVSKFARIFNQIVDNVPSVILSVRPTTNPANALEINTLSRNELARE